MYVSVASVIFRADIRTNLRESVGRFINMMSQSENQMIKSHIFDVILNVKTTAQVSCKILLRGSSRKANGTFCLAGL